MGGWGGSSRAQVRLGCERGERVNRGMHRSKRVRIQEGLGVPRAVGQGDWGTGSFGEKES